MKTLMKLSLPGLLLFVMSGAEAADKKEPATLKPLLYVPFDGDATAKVAGGESAATPLVSRTSGVPAGGEFQFTEGRKDKGIAVGDANPSVRYELEGNFTPAQGSLAFWAKPLNWSGPSKTHMLVSAARDTSGNFGWSVYQYADSQQGGVGFNVKGENEQTGHGVFDLKSDWEQGVWHHLLVTWDQDLIRLYIDGRLIGKTRLELPMDAAWMGRYLTVGPVISYGREGSTAIDELYVFDRPILPDDVPE